MHYARPGEVGQGMVGETLPAVRQQPVGPPVRPHGQPNSDPEYRLSPPGGAQDETAFHVKHSVARDWTRYVMESAARAPPE